MFLFTVIAIWTVAHAFVLWRLWSVPLLATPAGRRLLLAVMALGWIAYPLARILHWQHAHAAGRLLEFPGAAWMGVLFLLFAALLASDVLTGGGLLLGRHAPAVRGWVAGLALALSAIGLAQGLRDPVVRDYEVRLAGLPAERDGLVLVELSDMHLGTLIGGRWMQRQVARVEALEPDLVVVDGDLVDGNIHEVEPLLPILRQLRAPLGVWAVTGNHEFYAGVDRCVRLFEDAGYTVLRDRWVQAAPGLILAGVDDLTARRQFGLPDHPVERALAGRPPGATILFSHTPWQANAAAAAGAGLMLSGHTHDGQIWPFGYLVRPVYPLLSGRYKVGGLSVLVCRGTGTWGPRMRLWRPSEILRITLRAGGPAAAPPPTRPL